MVFFHFSTFYLKGKNRLVICCYVADIIIIIIIVGVLVLFVVGVVVGVVMD